MDEIRLACVVRIGRSVVEEAWNRQVGRRGTGGEKGLLEVGMDVGELEMGGGYSSAWTQTLVGDGIG